MPKIKRALFSDEEKELLLAQYEHVSKYPSKEWRQQLAKRLEKPVSQIANWFKNQRAQSGDSKSWIRPSTRNGLRKRARQDDDQPLTPVNEVSMVSSSCSGNLVIDESYNTMNSSHSEVLPKPKQRKMNSQKTMTIVDIKQESEGNICNSSPTQRSVPMSTPRHDHSINDVFAPSPISPVRYLVIIFPIKSNLARSSSYATQTSSVSSSIDESQSH
jgi:hypothetical protein